MHQLPKWFRTKTVQQFALLVSHSLPQNQFGYRDGGPNPAEASASGAQASVNQEATGGSGPAPEDQRCNGSLHKKSLSQAGGEDSGGQRYSADPTIFLGERAPRGDTDEDGYMTPMKDKSSSGREIRDVLNPQHGVDNTKLTNYITFSPIYIKNAKEIKVAHRFCCAVPQRHNLNIKQVHPVRFPSLVHLFPVISLLIHRVNTIFCSISRLSFCLFISFHSID